MVPVSRSAAIRRFDRDPARPAQQRFALALNARLPDVSHHMGRERAEGIVTAAARNDRRARIASRMALDLGHYGGRNVFGQHRAVAGEDAAAHAVDLVATHGESGRSLPESRAVAHLQLHRPAKNNAGREQKSHGA